MSNNINYTDKMKNKGKHRLNLFISNKNYNLLSKLSKNNNKYADNNLTKSDLADIGLTLLFKELENNKLNDLGLELKFKRGASDE